MLRSTVIFDLGNVVLYFDHGIICHKLSTQYGIDEEFVYQKIFQDGIEKEFDEGKLTPQEFTLQCSKSLSITLNITEFKKIWSDIFRENEEVIEIIKELKRNSLVFLLSNTNQWHFEHIKSHFSIIDLFDELILSFNVGYTKPHKMIFRRAVELSQGLFPVVYIDDIENHVEAAKQVGIQEVIHYTDTQKLREQLIELKLLH